MKRKEADVKRAVAHYLELNGWTVWRTNNMGWQNKQGRWIGHNRKGLPDLYAMKKGWPGFWIECKGPTGKLTDDQKKFLGMAEDAGCLVAAAWGVEDARAAIENYKKKEA